MNLIRTRTSISRRAGLRIRLPTEYFGFAYLLMEALLRKILDDRIAFSVPEQRRQDFAAQLAKYIYELSMIRFSNIGRLMPFNSREGVELSPSPIAGADSRLLSTSLEFFYHLRREQNRAILKDHKGEPQWEAAAWFLEKALTSMVTEDHIYGPFPLRHLDLHYKNILVDENYRITGILDWSNAQTVLVERFAISPEFVAPPAAPAEVKQAIYDFWDMFVAALGKIESGRESGSSPGRMSLSRLFGSPLSEVVFRCTYSYHWRAIYDAQLIMPLLYGENARWDDFQKFCTERFA